MKHTLGGSSGRDLNHIRLPFRSSWLRQTWCPSQPHSWPLSGWDQHPPRPRGLPGSVPHPREVPTLRNSANTPPSPFGLQLEGPGPPEWAACHSLCGDTMSPPPAPCLKDKQLRPCCPSPFPPSLGNTCWGNQTTAHLLLPTQTPPTTTTTGPQ